MENEKIHVVFASNHAYLQGLCATAVSMLRASAEPARLSYHVISDGLTEDDKHAFTGLCLKFGYTGTVDFRSQDMQYFKSTLKSFHGSHTTYARLHFPSVFQDLDWILWADVDTLWFRDSAKLWEERDNDVSLVWSPDFRQSQIESRPYFKSFFPTYDDRRYCCAGVMLMNLKRLREKDFEARCDAFIEKYGTPEHVDQDILNVLCYGDTKIVDRNWDCLDPCFNQKDGIVLHFQGIGSLFNKSFSHWHPAYEIWFRHYAQVIEGRTGAHVASLKLRLFYNLLGQIRTPYWLCRALSLLTLGKVRANNLYRPLYFCWLRNRLSW